MRSLCKSLRSCRPEAVKRRLDSSIRPVLEGLEERRLLAVAFDVATLAVAEGDAQIVVTVERTGALLPITVNYSAALASTATPGDDYVLGGGGQLTFLQDQATATFTVDLVDDATPEPAETIVLQLGGIVPVGDDTLGDPATLTLTIAASDDFVAPIIAMQDATVSVSEAVDGGNLVLTVVRSGNTAVEASALWSIVPGTATPDADHGNVGGTVTFLADQTTATITIPILQDTDEEADETFTVQLGGLTGGAVLGATATTVVTIQDDDTVTGPGEFAFQNAAYSFVEGVGTVTVTVVRTGGSAGAVTIPFTVTPGTATNADYTIGTTSPLTFAAGDTSETISITIVGDAAAEAAEQFTIALGAPSAGTLGATGTTAVTITDAVIPGTFAFAQPTYTFDESAGTVTVTVLRTGGASGGITVPFVVALGTADFTVVTTSPLTFANGENSRSISIAIADNDLDEADKTFTITLQEPSDGSLGATAAATVTIQDNDVAGTFAFEQAGYRVAENAAAGVITINVLRTGGSDGQIEVPFSVANATASGADYTFDTVSPLVFADGVTTLTITITLVNDGDDESDETFTIAMDAPTPAGGLGATAATTVTIADDEGAGTFAVGAPTYSFAEGAGTVTITVLRTDGFAGEVTVPFTVTPGTAGEGDYTVVTTSPLTFAEGVASQTITLTLNDNLAIEEDRTFTVALGAPAPVESGATLGATDTATIAILDDDGPGVIEFEGEAAVTVVEGGQVILTLRRSLGVGGAVTVTYTVTGTASAGDYTITPASPVTFAEGEAVKSITLGTVQDLLIESNETIIVTLSDPTGGATLGEATSVTVTVDDDDAAGVLAFQQSAYSVTEGQAATITVVRTGGISGTVTVSYTIVAPAGATQDADYTLSAGTLTFAEGVATQTITIPIIQDTLVEGSEIIVLQLNSPTGGATLGGIVTTSVTILDDETTGPNQAPTALPVVATRAPGQTIEVRPSVTDPDGDPLTLSLVTGPRWGVVTLNDAGTPANPSDDFFVYTPAAGEVKNDSFIYLVSDGRGGTAQAQASVFVRGAGLVVSPFDQTQLDVVVVGTVDDDEVFVARSAASGNTNVNVNGTLYGPFNPTGRVLVLASLGDDLVQNRGLNAPMWVYGLTGNDTIIGSGQGDVLLGHAGNDVIKGLGGRNLLIGGTGRDTIFAGSNIDVLIGGSLRYETYTVANQARLNDVVDALRTALDLDSFIDEITSPTGVGASRTTFSSTTITDDGTRDILEGRGASDWLIGQNEFFRDASDDDVISDDLA